MVSTPPSVAWQHTNTCCSPAPDAELAESGAIEIEWDALIPLDRRPDKLMDEYDAHNLSEF